MLNRHSRTAMRAWAAALCFVAAPMAAAQDGASGLGNIALFMRHAIAPGFGDPPHFVIDDCATQRNLDGEGRAQAREIGRRLKRAGVRPAAVYSSRWCRCLETARLLDLGEVQAHDGLNSYFQNFVDKRRTLQKLRALMKSLPPQSGPYLFVTHQVVMTDITGVTPASGEIVAYDFITGEAFRFDLNESL